MSRVIKFRVWDKLEKRFIYPDVGYQGHFCLSLKGSFFNLQNGSGGGDYVVHQFTGLVDKNGEDLYEGDIVKYIIRLDDHGDIERHTGQLLWSEKYAAWGLGVTEPWNLLTDYYVRIEEKIGNIFEDGKLMEGMNDS